MRIDDVDIFEQLQIIVILMINQIGAYSILRKLDITLNDNALEFIVTRISQNNCLQLNTYQYRAQLILLRQYNIHQMRNKNVFFTHCNDLSYLVETFFIIIDDRKYVVKIKDDQKRRVIDVDLRKIKVTPSICRKLMIQSLMLIKELHQVGAWLNQDLEDYIQFRLTNLQTKQYQMEIVNLRNRRSKVLNIFGNHNKFLSNALRKQEVEKLYSFYNALLNQLSLKSFTNHPTTNLLMNLLTEGLNDQKEVSLKVLQNILLAEWVKQQSYFFACNFDFKTTLLSIQIQDKISNKTQSFFLNTPINIQKSNQLMEIDQLFYIISSKQQNEVRILSTNTISFLNQQTNNWNIVDFSKIKCNMQNNFIKNQFGSDQQEQVQQGDCKSQQKITTVQGNTQYPFNCIVPIKSIFDKDVSAYPITGVGSLIGEKIVLTCAHLVVHKFKRAKQVFVTFGKKSIKVAEFEYAKDNVLPHERKKRQNDYALLYLESPAILERYLMIAKNYKSESKLQLAKIKEQGAIKIVSLQMTEKPMQIQDVNILEHTIKTKKGDSGSPILVQVKQERRLYYIISIHASARSKANKSVKLTNIIVERLIQFQEAMIKKPDNPVIKLHTIIYEQLIQSIKKRFYQKQIDVNKSIKLKKNSKVSNLPLTFNEIFNNVPEIKNLAKNGSNEINWLSNIDFLQSVMKQFANDIDNFQENELNNPLFLKLNRISQGMNKKQIKKDSKDTFIAKEQTLFQNCSQSSSWQKFVLILKLPQYRNIMTSISQLLKMKWQLFPLIQKSRKNISTYNNQIQFLIKQISLPMQLGDRNNIFFQFFPNSTFDKLKKILIQRFLAQQYVVRDLQPKKVPILQSYLSFTKTYFNSFQYKGFYSAYNVYQFQFEVQIEAKNHLLTAAWCLIDFQHQHYAFTFPNVLTKQLKHYLKVKFKSPFYLTVTDLLHQNTIQPVKLIKLMIKIAKFIDYLHEHELQLCIPIEYCLFLDINNGNVLFYYFEHYYTLYYRIKQLTQQQKKAAAEYYPVDQILSSNQESRAPFLKIDVWILGKSLERLFSSLTSNFTHNDKQLLCYKELIAQMICEPGQRISIKDVCDLLGVMLYLCTKAE